MELLVEKLKHMVKPITLLTIVNITHDMSEIVKLCDRIGVLQKGVIIHWDPQGSSRKFS